VDWPASTKRCGDSQRPVEVSSDCLTETFSPRIRPLVGKHLPNLSTRAKDLHTSSQLTSPTYGSLSLNNGSGDSFNLQTSSSGPMTESLSLGSDGVITPASNVAALNSLLNADGTPQSTKMSQCRWLNRLGVRVQYCLRSSRGYYRPTTRCSWMQTFRRHT